MKYIPITYSIKRVHALVLASIISYAFWAADSANAQVVVSISSNAPTENIADSFVADDSTNNWQWRYSTEYGYRDLGQRFTASTSGILDAITVQSYYTAGAGTVDASFTLTVYSFTNTSASAEIDEVLLTVTGTLPSTVISALSYITFDLSDTLELEEGVSYGFLLHFDTGPTSEKAINIVIGTSSDYDIPDGSYLLENTGDYPPSSVSASTERSLEYYIQVIPEPSSSAIAMGIVAVLAVTLMSRKQKKR